MLVALAALALRRVLAPWLGPDTPFITFFPAVALAGWYGGLGPGVLATAIGALAGDYFFAGGGGFTLTTGAGLLRFATFAGMGVLISAVCEQLHRAREGRDEDAGQRARLLEEREKAVSGQAEALLRMEATARRLMESEQRFQTVADAAPVLIWMSGPDKLCTWFNKGWLEFTGRSMEQELGNGWAEGVHPEDLGRVLETYTGAFDRREPFDIDYRMRRHDGRWRWIMNQGRPVHSPEGEFLGYIGSCVDVTDRRIAEEERQRLLESERAARNEAELASRVKDEFLGTISHELRTPLQAILGWARLLRGNRVGGDEVLRAAEVIERNAAIQAQLIDDLLDVSRIISGKLRLDVDRIDLPAVIERRGRRRRARRPTPSRSEIHTELDPRAGAVPGDPIGSQQVVWNLLSNAVKFTPPGTAGRRRARARRLDVELAVSDTGSGIAPEFLPHVFERFRQADGSTTRAPRRPRPRASSIVRHLVELHGGTVRADERGRGPRRDVHGRRCRARLRRRRGASPSARTPAGRRADARSTRRSTPGVRVLVVDDEPDARELLRRALLERAPRRRSHRGLRRRGARLRRCRRAPDVLVSDIGMPGEDGYSLIRASARRGPAAPAARARDRAHRLRAPRGSHPRAARRLPACTSPSRSTRWS